ncbi:hypothetical protein CHU98_g9390 [Xylaria longipes]|nr:hypothetical protein CHU98_g9390 [Xylaria longipes]
MIPSLRESEIKRRQTNEKAHMVLKTAIAQLNNKDREIHSLQKNREELQGRVDTLTWEAKSAQDQEARVTAAKQEPKTKLDEAYRDYRALQDTMIEQGRKIRELEANGAAGRRSLRAEVDRLQREIQQGRRDHEEQKKAAVYLRSDIDALQAERDNLEQKLARISASENVTASLEAQLENERLLKESLSTQVEDLNAEVNERRKEHSKAIVRLQEQVFEKNAQLKASAHANQSKQKTLEEDALKLQAALKKSEEEKVVLERKAAEIEAQARDQVKSHQIATNRYEKEIKERRAEIATLQDQVEALLGDSGQTLAFEETVAEMERLTRCKDSGIRAVHEVAHQWKLNDGLRWENMSLKMQIDRERRDRRPFLESYHYFHNRIRTLGWPESPSGTARRGRTFFIDRILQGDGADGDVWEEALPVLESARNGDQVALVLAGRADEGESNVMIDQLLRRIGDWLFNGASARGGPILGLSVLCSALCGEDLWDLLAERESQGLPQVLPPSGPINFSDVSFAQSRAEQAQLNTATGDGVDETERLAALNREYEARFPGLRYVVFVNGRGRDVIMDDMRRRIDRGDIRVEEREGIQLLVSERNHTEEANTGTASRVLSAARSLDSIVDDRTRLQSTYLASPFPLIAEYDDDVSDPYQPFVKMTVSMSTTCADQSAAGNWVQSTSHHQEVLVSAGYGEDYARVSRWYTLLQQPTLNDVVQRQMMLLHARHWRWLPAHYL